MYKVLWSPAAQSTFFEILSYLEEHWSTSEAAAFIDRTDEIINFIKNRPSLFQYSKSSNTHKCVLTKQVSLFYRVNTNSDQVELLLFWDNRQDPEQLSI